MRTNSNAADAVVIWSGRVLRLRHDRRGPKINVFKASTAGEKEQFRQVGVGHRLADRLFGDEPMAGRGVEAEAGSRVALRIQVDEERAATGLGESRAEVDGGRGFARRRLSDSLRTVRDPLAFAPP